MSGNSILKVTFLGLFLFPHRTVFIEREVEYYVCAKDGRSINENYGTDLDKLEEGDKVGVLGRQLIND